jgi:hypothetical protein
MHSTLNYVSPIQFEQDWPGDDVYRFGGAELNVTSGPTTVGEFFERLFRACRLGF